MPTQYDQKHFDPPAPVATAEIIHPVQKHLKTNIEMQLDSGSDITCIPVSINKRLPHLRSGYRDAEDYNGQWDRLATRFITVRIGEEEFPLIEAIEIKGEIGILGRDVLNKYRIVLDGPRLKFQLEQSHEPK